MLATHTQTDIHICIYISHIAQQSLCLLLLLLLLLLLRCLGALIFFNLSNEIAFSTCVVRQSRKKKPKKILENSRKYNVDTFSRGSLAASVCVCVGACVSCLFYSLFTLHINWNLRASPRFSFSSSLLLFLLLLSVAPLWQFSWLPVFYFILFFSCIFLHFLLVCVAHIALMNFSLWVMQDMSEEKWKRERGRGGAIKTYLAKLQQSKWRIWKFA